MARYSSNETKSISLYQVEKRNGELHIISGNKKNKRFTEEQKRAQRREEEEEVATLTHKDDEIGRASTRTVMVCDDERDILLSFAIRLQAKYNVLTAKSGEECIKKYLDAKGSGRKIDLILLDYRLGDTTGEYVARKIKESNDVKIIIITAYEVNLDIIRELEDNQLVIDIVQKPIAIDSLVTRVEQSVGN